MNITKIFTKPEFLTMCAALKNLECSNINFVATIVDHLEYEDTSTVDFETLLQKVHNLDGLGMYKTMVKIYEFWDTPESPFDAEQRLVEIDLTWENS